MRAATHIGLTFVGAGNGAGRTPPDEDRFQPRIVTPDFERQAMRAACIEAISDNIEFRRSELAQWTAEFGYEAVEKLREWARDG